MVAEIGRNYLVRHEIIALQSVTGGGPQSYPVCFQANIKSSGTLHPTDTIRFPGVYSTTKDIFSKGFWVGGAENYELPGPRPISSESSNTSGGNTGVADAAGGAESATVDVPGSSSVVEATVAAVSTPPISTDPAMTTTNGVAALATPTIATQSPVVTAVTPVEAPNPVVEGTTTSPLPAAPVQTGRRGGRWRNSPPAKRANVTASPSGKNNAYFDLL